jgi:hypothetical protein
MLRPKATTRPLAKGIAETKQCFSVGARTKHMDVQRRVGLCIHSRVCEREREREREREIVLKRGSQ